jgi:hypothetical protein
MSSNITLNNTTLAPLPPFLTIAYLYVIPSMGAIGCVFNVICLVVLLHPNMSGDTYKLLVLKTILSMLVLTIAAGSVITNCPWCWFSNSLASQLYRQYLLNGVNNVVMTSIALVEIALAYDRLYILKRKAKSLIKFRFSFILTVILTISIAVNIPYFFAYWLLEIEPGSNRFAFGRSSFGQTSFFNTYVLILNFMQSFLTLLLLIIIDTSVSISFRNYIKRKTLLLAAPKKLTNNKTKNNAEASVTLTLDNSKGDRGNKRATNKTRKEKFNSKKNFTMMLLVASLIYTMTSLISFANIGFSTIVRLLGRQTTVLNIYFMVFSYIAFCLYFGSNLFIYFAFNRTFRTCFGKIFHFKF